MQLFIGVQTDDETLFLTEEESWHCAKVLRKRNGDLLSVIDGKGNLFSGKIVSDNPKKVLLAIESKEAKKTARDYKLHIAIAPTKNIDRIEWFIEKATELGVKNIYPIQTKRTEKSSIKEERLNNIIISAIKQSKQLYLPTLFPLQPFKEVIRQTQSIPQKFIAHCADNPVRLQNVFQNDKEAIVFIGPEGDFTTDEILLAQQNGFVPISLGNSILRTETAGVYVTGLIRMLLG